MFFVLQPPTQEMTMSVSSSNWLLKLAAQYERLSMGFLETLQALLVTAPFPSSSQSAERQAKAERERVNDALITLLFKRKNPDYSRRSSTAETTGLFHTWILQHKRDLTTLLERQGSDWIERFKQFEKRATTPPSPMATEAILAEKRRHEKKFEKLIREIEAELY